jgi:hypothetical protein
MLLAFYLATGQDAANIVEGSQGFTLAEARGEAGLYFSVTLPNLIVGTVGNGKGLPFVEENLRDLGCLEAREPGANARRLAILCAATVLCGELSLLAAQTNPGELMAAHLKLERGGRAWPKSRSSWWTPTTASSARWTSWPRTSAAACGTAPFRCSSSMRGGAGCCSGARRANTIFRGCGPTRAAAIRGRARTPRTPRTGGCARSWASIARWSERFQFEYKATSEAEGLTEHELDHVFTGVYAGRSGPIPERSATCAGWIPRNWSAKCASIRKPSRRGSSWRWTAGARGGRRLFRNRAVFHAVV